MNTKYHQTEGFKFNPAGLIGLDAGTAKGISKFLRARERELNTIETEVITCEGGPFNGQQIELQPNGGLAAPAKSAEFTVGAWRGHYLGSKWVSTLAADAPAPEAMAAPLSRPKINCDLPAKGFDQLRDLLGEMSINPLEQETHLKPITRLKYFKYGQIDDFGYAIEEAAPAGAYSVSLSWAAAKINRKNRSTSKHIINRTPHDGNTWAMDDYGDLFQIKHPEFTSKDAENLTVYHRFTTYKIGRTSYTIPATIEAIERLAAKILKVKKFCSDKVLSLGGTACPAVKTQPNRHIEPAAILPTPELQHVAIVEPALNHIDNRRRRIITNNPIAGLVFGEAAFTPEGTQINPRKTDTPPTLLPKIEQPAKPLATTCNPEAARLRVKATICRQANRPAWAKILEDKADALDRVDPPEPPPCKNKNKMQLQRPRKTACTRLAKIRHPARHFESQKYGEPIRQNLRPPTSELPGIKTVTPSAHFYQTTQTERLTPWPALNLHPVTHLQPLSRSKKNEATYPCPPPPSFAASALQPGKTGKPAAFPCPPPFGTYSTSYWITQSCRTRIKKTLPVQTLPVQISHVKNLAFSLLIF